MYAWYILSFHELGTADTFGRELVSEAETRERVAAKGESPHFVPALVLLAQFFCIESWEPQRGGAPRLRPVFGCIESWEPQRGGARGYARFFIALKAGSRISFPNFPAQFLLH